ncbi:PAS domain S-box protein [Kamptonema cortianum]|uniref:PAS domain S-box protein n=1 Tax=Geitlerinema calcuttense NRMC-F 0142 TaxID=2922238 RepID=A0ABT7LYE0_9CYAN|nr:PAS domain-containing protein [Geitlerinema calcuttense]MDI9640242.1 PAS domain S-box protein [Geitlerinema splendidum]MDK3157410.1 PAS domain S-box protein [Kamptonema cortianum]MDL5057022.1 PAS domain S-box protein [Geitlerinema calcuttense NRMC-F 0142]
MKKNGFSSQLTALNGRLTELFNKATTLPSIPSYLASDAFKELSFASEELQVAYEQILHQNSELERVYDELRSANQRYRAIFELMPEAYLITSASGKIEEANSAAAQLLNIQQQFLPGKMLSLFIHPEDRSTFYLETSRIHRRSHKQEWQLRFRDRLGETHYTAVTVAPLGESLNEGDRLLWCVRNITEQKRAEMALTASLAEIQQERPPHIYDKGEIIPLNPHTLWLVCEGLVKLSTFCENNDEMLIGLVGASMPFGCHLTALNIYQATALSEVKLVSISMSELSAFPIFAQVILNQYNRRLQQTELLLANFGRRNVEERLWNLLCLLKEEIGEPVAEGTRLTVRLTHQDLANACSTSRVTVTRLLNKFRQDNRLICDRHHHLIVVNSQL